MKYCRTCLLPDTKPYITFDAEGVCGACQANVRKRHTEAGIDWDARACDFETLITEVKAQQAPLYDVLVPVSGGKDSISQVHQMLGRGLRILAVNIDYGIKTAVGRRNLARVAEMGAGLLVYTPGDPLHRDLIRLGLLEYGDPDLMSHCLLHAYPLRLALRLQIPLFWGGENSAIEYSGETGASGSTGMTRAWFERYAANAGRTPRWMAEHHGIPYERLVTYDFPDELPTSSTRAAFMSWYFPWDSETNLATARQYGFESLPAAGEGTYRTYVGIDEMINRVHQYLKVLKFGYGRATDHACEDIRAGRLTRAAAKDLVRQYDLQPLSDEFADSICAFISLSRREFDATLERYRNPAIWRRSPQGQWTIPGHLED